jgi:hypothetical protein
MRWLRRLGPAAAVLVASTGTAAAHQLSGSRFDAPIPLSLLFIGAGLTVAVTAAWLARPARSVPAERSRPLVSLRPRTARGLRTVARVVFFVVFVAAIVAGLRGRQVAAENLATVFVWPVWFKGVAVVAAVFGSPWRVLSPWRALYDALAAIEGGELAALGSPPERLGAWPALVGYLAVVGVVENLTTIPRSPAATAGLVAGYAAVMVAGGVAFGRAWFRRADAFEVLYRLFGRVAPLRFRERDGAVVLLARTPWEGCTRPVSTAVLAGFVVATVYTVSFDGFTSTPEYQTLVFVVRDAVGVGPAVSVPLYLGGFLAFWGLFAAVVALSEGVGDGDDAPAAVRTLAPTLLPIAAGVSRLILGEAVDRFYRKRVMAGSFLLAGLFRVGLVGAGEAGNGAVFVAFVLGAMFFSSPLYVFFPSLLADYYGAANSSGNYAVLYTAKVGGGVFSGVVAGYLVATMGWNATFVLGGGLATAAGLAVFVLRPPSGSGLESPEPSAAD